MSKVNLAKAIATKLPLPHTRTQRIDELNQLLSNIPDTLSSLFIFTGQVVNRLNAQTDEQYEGQLKSEMALLELSKPLIRSGVRNNNPQVFIPDSLHLTNLSGRTSKPYHLNNSVGVSDIWKVNTKTDGNKTSVEVAAVVEGSHGDTSWGWHDNERKVVVLRIASLYQKRPISDAIIELAEKEAQAICDERNKKDGTVQNQGKVFLEKQVRDLFDSPEFVLADEDYLTFLGLVKNMTFEAGSLEMPLAFATACIMDKDDLIVERNKRDKDLLILIHIVIDIYRHKAEAKSTSLLVLESVKKYIPTNDLDFRLSIFKGETGFDEVVKLIRKPNTPQTF